MLSPENLKFSSLKRGILSWTSSKVKRGFQMMKLLMWKGGSLPLLYERSSLEKEVSNIWAIKMPILPYLLAVLNADLFSKFYWNAINKIKVCLRFKFQETLIILSDYYLSTFEITKSPQEYHTNGESQLFILKSQKRKLSHPTHRKFPFPNEGSRSRSQP